jgi:cytochrome P450
VETAEGHPWITTIKESLHASMFIDMFRRVPLLKLWPSLIRPEGLVKQRKEHFRLSREKAERRMKMGNEREDFFAHILSEKASDLSLESLTGQANTMVIAGSETTATFLAGMNTTSRRIESAKSSSGTTYFLLKNPSILNHLTEEIRSAFSDHKMINSDSTQNLPYLFAVIEEGCACFLQCLLVYNA